MAGVDRVLTAAVAGLPRVIGDDYLGRARKPQDSPKPNTTPWSDTLNDLADRAGVYYVYAFAADGNDFVSLATSASPAERTSGDWAKFRQPYEEPPESLRQTFADGKTRFAEYVDEFGSFRSVFVRQEVPGKGEYVVGVDVPLAQIHHDLNMLVWEYLAAGSLRLAARRAGRTS